MAKAGFAFHPFLKSNVVALWKGFAPAQTKSVMRCQNEEAPFNPIKAGGRLSCLSFPLFPQRDWVRGFNFLNPWAKERNHAGYEYAKAV